MTLTAVDDSHQALVVPKGLELLHLSPSIGTEVHGIDLRNVLTPETQSFLKALMLERKVIFFRDQDITIEQHMAVCRTWGELEIIDFLPQHPDYPEVLHIKRDKNNKAYENVWHSDVTWRESPSFGSMLRAMHVPDVGGDTLFADMYAAYDGLPSALKRACEGLMAVHSVANGLSLTQDAETIRKALIKYPPQAHPVIRTHPETGKKLIYVNRAHTSHLKGMRRDHGAQLLEMLYNQANTPEYQCRFRWQKNSIAFWDNRSCQHYAAADYFPKEREMMRVTVVGDKPY
jgi:taurine dioxygenase